MSEATIEDFVNQSCQRDRGEGLFELETPRMLELNLNGSLWIKMGAMVSYRGDVKFTREGIMDRGMGNLLKKAVSGEGARLTKVEGRGQVYLADSGKKITIIRLQGESICINGSDLLAFEESVQFEIKMLKKVSGMLSGGLFNVRLQGSGLIAFTTHYDPVTLLVTPENPVVTDPNATVAWSGSLEPELRVDVSFKTFLGRGSGESIQTVYAGDGFVVIQPYEEVTFQAS